MPGNPSSGMRRDEKKLICSYYRLDAVQDLMNNPDFSERFSKMARNVPDLERLISRIHAGRCKQADFLKVLDAFEKISTGFVRLIQLAEGFEGTSVANLLKTCPDLTSFMDNLRAMYTLPDGGEPSFPLLVLEFQRCTDTLP
jgi:DNA mismatch repair protein MSH6